MPSQRGGELVFIPSVVEAIGETPQFFRNKVFHRKKDNPFGLFMIPSEQKKITVAWASRP